jgi:hypothetical protein
LEGEIVYVAYFLGPADITPLHYLIPCPILVLHWYFDALAWLARFVSPCYFRRDENNRLNLYLPCRVQGDLHILSLLYNVDFGTAPDRLTCEVYVKGQLLVPNLQALNERGKIRGSEVKAGAVRSEAVI